MIRLAHILLIFMLLTACNDHSVERKQVADLMDQIDAAESKLQAIDTSKLPMSDTDVKGRIDVISGYYKDNDILIDRYMGVTLGDYKVYRKVFKGLPEKLAAIQKEIDLSRKQLRDLDQDLKGNALEKGFAEKYITEERLATEAISASLVQLDSLFSRGSRGYLRMTPRIDAIIDSLGLSYPPVSLAE